jgi:flavin-binding monooxygenase-like protein
MTRPIAPGIHRDAAVRPARHADPRRLYKRMFKPGLYNLVFVGLAQGVPTLFPLVECQSRLLAAYAVGRYALPPVAEMERTIDADQLKHTGHCTDRPRHTQQVDYFIYEHDVRTRELPAWHQTR